MSTKFTASVYLVLLLTLGKKHISKPTVVEKHMLRITSKCTNHNQILFQ